MPKVQKKEKQLPKVNEININKIPLMFKKSILIKILKILCMEHGGFRTFKTVKNINRLFANIDMRKYRTNPELETYIWCISYMSKKWLDGIVSPDLAFEMMKNDPNYTNVAGDIITACMSDKEIITAPEANAIFKRITEMLQLGFVVGVKDEYINLLEDINLDNPGAFVELMNRLTEVSQSVLDIKYSTNMVANKIQFSTTDNDSIKEALSSTMSSLSEKSGMLKIGIRRFNTLLSPAYMNGRLYVFAGLPGSYKSGILLKSVLDIRKYNPGFETKTPGMKPCCLYITMENTFEETIERMWNMTFDEPMTNYDLDQAIEMLSKELGIGRIINDNLPVKELDDNGNVVQTLESQLLLDGPDTKEPNIEIVIQYYPYRSINTDDLFTIINDLRDENLEVCAFVFDYIKRIEPAHPIQDNERLEIDRICNELKALAVIQNIPVITAHQLNRGGASAIDAAARAGKHDLIKEAGRENIGGAWAVAEVADFLAIVGTEYKSGTNEKFFTINVLKRRRIDAAESEFAKFTYLAHPFSARNPFKLLDDLWGDKILSLQSLVSDVDLLDGKEKANATKRLKLLEASEFDENY